MGLGNNWPDFIPDLDLTLEVDSGYLDVGSGSAIDNYSDYSSRSGWLKGTLWRNGTKVSAFSIDGSGNISLASAIPVSTNDAIEARFDFAGIASLPWVTHCLVRRAAFMKVPAGTSSTTFDGSTNVMPVPSWDLAFGWHTDDKLKVGFKVNGDDGASQDMTVTTRLVGSDVDKSSSDTIDLDDTSSTQTHTADFVDTDVEIACEIKTHLANATTDTHVDDTIRIVLLATTELGSYPASFPSSGTMLEHRKPGGTHAGELDQP